MAEKMANKLVYHESCRYINVEKSHTNRTKLMRPTWFGIAAHWLPTPPMSGAARPIVWFKQSNVEASMPGGKGTSGVPSASKIAVLLYPSSESEILDAR